MLAAVLCAATSALAAPGDPVVSFGSGGVAAFSPGTSAPVAEGLVGAPNGGVVVAGWGRDSSPQKALLFGVTPAGALDPGFPYRWTAFEAPPGGTLGHDLVRDAQGRLLLAASSANGTVHADVGRFLADGRPDTSFDGDGLAQVRVDDYDASANALAVQPDGRIVVAGYYADSAAPNTHHAFVGRLNADGTPDTSGFAAAGGDPGVATVDVGDGSDTAIDAVGLTPGGKIVASGHALTAGDSRAFVVRFNANGTPDATFHASNGVVIDSELYRADGLVVAGDGAYVAGVAVTTNRGAVGHINGNGTFDATWGSGGHAATSTAQNSVFPGALAFDPQGRLLAAGSSSGALGVARFTDANGALDTTFGAGGIARSPATSTLPETTTSSLRTALAVGADGTITVAANVLKQISGNAYGPDHIVVGRFEGGDRAPEPPPAQTTPAPPPTTTTGEAGGPQADLTPVSGARPGVPVVLDASGSTGRGLTFAFDLDGDGSYEHATGTTASATTTFAKAARYTVGVRVTDADGKAGTATASVDVSAPLDATLALSRARLHIGQKVTFSQTVHADQRFGPAYFGYDFGDDSAPAKSTIRGRWTFPGRDVRIAPTATHSYDKPGVYAYQLEAVAGDGQTVVQGGQIDVTAADDGRARPAAASSQPTGTHPQHYPGDDYTGPPVTVSYDGPGETGRKIAFHVASDLDTTQTSVVGGDPGDPTMGEQPKVYTETKTLARGGVATYYMGDGGPPTHNPATGETSYPGETVIHTNTTRGALNDIVFAYKKPGLYHVRASYATSGHGTGYATVKVRVDDPICGSFKMLDLPATVKGNPAQGSCLHPIGDGGFVANVPVSIDGMLVRSGRWQPHPGYEEQTEALPFAVYPGTGTVGPVPGSNDLAPGEKQLRVHIGDADVWAADQFQLPAGKGKGFAAYRNVPGLSYATPGNGLSPLERYEQVHVDGRSVSVSPIAPAYAKLALHLPAPFNDPVEKRVGSAVAAADEFKLEGGPIGFGPVQVKHFSLERDQYGWLHGGGDIVLFGDELNADDRTPGPPVYPGDAQTGGPSGFGIDDQGAFRYGGLYFDTETHGGTPIALGPVGVTYIGAKLTTDPFFFRGDIHLQFPVDDPIVKLHVCVQLQQVSKGDLVIACQPYSAVDCAAGPVKAPITGINVCDYAEKAKTNFFLAHFEGDVNVLGLHVGNGAFELRTGGERQLTADINVGVKVSILDLRGGVEGYAKFTQQNKLRAFQVYGYVQGSIAGQDFLKIEGLVNQHYLAGCAHVLFGYVGGYYDFVKKDGDTFADWGNCHLKQSKYYIDVSEARALGRLEGRATASPLGSMRRDVTMPAGLPWGRIMVRGAGGVPRLEITGPGGFAITDTGAPTTTVPGAELVRLPGDSAVALVLTRPHAGRYHIRVVDGPAMEKLAVDSGERDPIVRASVTGHGPRRILHYLVEARPSQRVHFVEEAQGIANEIGVVHAGRGSLRFLPALGGAGTRRITAFIEANGGPQPKMDVTTYVAPEPPDGAPPVRVTGRRGRSGRLDIAWSEVPGTRRYTVAIRFGDGSKRRVVLGPRQRTLRIKGFAPTQSARISVRATDPYGRDTRPRTTRVAAAKKLGPVVVGTGRKHG